MITIMVNSFDFVTVEPEYDWRENDTKIEYRMQSRSGKQFIYKWDDVQKLTMSVRFVSQTIADTLNGYWRENKVLKVFDTDASPADITSYYLVNRSKPIDQRIKPYTDLYKGKLEFSR